MSTRDLEPQASVNNSSLELQKIIKDADGLKAVRDLHPGKKIVQCHGVFDLFHPGHLSYFESARKLGDVLVVTITSDEFVNKGPGRPCYNTFVRARTLAALEIIDYVGYSAYPTAVQTILSLKPDVYVKGPDYKEASRDLTGGIVQEERAVESVGGKLAVTADDVLSSSGLLNKFFSPWTEEQNVVIEQVKKEGGLRTIEEVFQTISKKKVCVISEPIIDTYIFCQPEALSSKNPSISAKYIFEENYAGGGLAIANHLVDFTGSTSLVMTHGNEIFVQGFLKEAMDPRIIIHKEILDGIPTPRKTRYIAHNSNHRLFELTDLRSDQWTTHSPKNFCEMIRKENSESDATIVADFGHGLFESAVLDTTSQFKGFVGLNVQTNSSNFGFNPYTKHRRFSYLSIDTKEVRVAYHDRQTPPLDLFAKLHNDIRTSEASCAMTLGASGSYYYSAKNGDRYFCPAFSDKVVDATGAGDAYFGMTSLLVESGCPEIFIPFLGNVFAGLKTKILGNKKPVSKALLMKAVTSILKE